MGTGGGKQSGGRDKGEKNAHAPLPWRRAPTYGDGKREGGLGSLRGQRCGEHLPIRLVRHPGSDGEGKDQEKGWGRDGKKRGQKQGHRGQKSLRQKRRSGWRGDALVFGVDKGRRVACDAHGTVLCDNGGKLDAGDKATALAKGDGVGHQQLVLNAFLAKVDRRMKGQNGARGRQLSAGG